MKKLLGILVLGLMLSASAYADLKKNAKSWYVWVSNYVIWENGERFNSTAN